MSGKGTSQFCAFVEGEGAGVDLAGALAAKKGWIVLDEVEIADALIGEDSMTMAQGGLDPRSEVRS